MTTASSRALGDEMRTLRATVGITAATAAEYLGWDPVTVVQAENGVHPLSELELLHYLALCGLDQAGVREFLVRHDRARMPDSLRTLVLAETVASAITCFDVVTMPVLLQTEDYATALCEQLGLTLRTEIAATVQTRVQRQAVLHRRGRPRCMFFLHENALRTEIGGNRVMEDQVLHLLFHAAMIRVVPSSAFTGDYTLIQYEHERPLVYAETDLSSTLTQEPAAIARSQLIFERIADIALGGEESREVLMRYLEQYDR